jgi:hypothetical protein
LMFQSLWWMSLKFWWGLHWTCRLILATAIFTVLILPIYVHGRSFHLLWSSLISFFNGLWLSL